MEEQIPGATSLNDLRAANSDPFNKASRIKRFFLDDSFRAICIGFVLSSLALTIIMIFDANLGQGNDYILHLCLYNFNSERSKIFHFHRSKLEEEILTN